MEGKLNSLYLVGITLFYLISLIKSDYDVVVFVTGTVLLIAGIVLFIRNKRSSKK